MDKYKLICALFATGLLITVPTICHAAGLAIERAEELLYEPQGGGNLLAPNESLVTTIRAEPLAAPPAEVPELAKPNSSILNSRGATSAPNCPDCSGVNLLQAGCPTLEPPLVVLHPSDESTTTLTSTDAPRLEEFVALGPLLIQVQFSLPADLEQNNSGEGAVVEIRVDDAPWDKRLTASYDAQSGTYATEFSIPCPTLGTHGIRARYRIGTCWSPWSSAVQFRTVPPPTPKIVALGDCEDFLSPVSRGELNELRTEKAILRVGLDRPINGLKYIVSLDGQTVKPDGIRLPCECTYADGCCRLALKLRGHVVPGIYSVTIVSVTPCGVSSTPSEPVLIRWNPGSLTECQDDSQHIGYASWMNATLPEKLTLVAMHASHCAEPAHHHHGERHHWHKPVETTECSAIIAFLKRQIIEKQGQQKLLEEQISDARKTITEVGEEIEETDKKLEELSRLERIITALGKHKELEKSTNEFLGMLHSKLKGITEEDAQTIKQELTAAVEAQQQKIKEATDEIAKIDLGFLQGVAADQERFKVQRAEHERLKQSEERSIEQKMQRNEQLESEIKLLKEALEKQDGSLPLTSDSSGSGTLGPCVRLPRASLLLTSLSHHVMDTTNQEPAPIAQDCNKELVLCSPERVTSNSFSFLPDLSAITHRQDQPNEDVTEQPTSTLPYEYRFHSPAFFPRRGFGRAGEVYDRDGVLVYEGMRFSCDCEGNYEVEFVAETPSVPVDLRLQLQVKRSGGDWYTLTLPPIHVAADEDAPDQPRQHTIRHEGYSSALKSLKLEGDADRDCLQLKRTGTARFGFGAEQFREANG